MVNSAKCFFQVYSYNPHWNIIFNSFRRVIDAAYDHKQEGVRMVFLDGAKAFVRIKPESSLQALRRFGFSTKMVTMIGSIYHERQFFVKDPNGNSSTHFQHAGIARGCPLSPCLFIVV